MSMVQIGLLGIVGVLLSIQLQKTNKEFSMMIGIAIALFIFFQIITRLEVVMDTMRTLESITSINIEYINVVLKMLGISYVAEFTAGICKESGYGNVASQIQLFGKIYIIFLGLPILVTLLETIETFIS